MNRAFLRGTIALAGVLAVAPLLSMPRAAGSEGFLYGKVTARSGTPYEGRIRWGDEEASWGDLFNSVKEDRPYLEDVPSRYRRQRQPIRIFGINIGLRWSSVQSERLFKARFGDISAIRPEGDDRGVVVMKSGSEIAIDGGSNDVGGRVHVFDAAVGEIALDWEKIREIRFLPTPPDLQVGFHRLHGTVQTRSGDFNGFIQWDQDECLSIDKLDGESEDGKLAIEMGRIRSIEKHSSSASKVTLEDGRTLILRESNDVNAENRGIFVDDDRYGRVLVSWEAFKKAEFTRVAGSGPSYGSFSAGKPLAGRVSRADGLSFPGRIVYDMDESESWEILDGDWRDISYAIPMGRIASIIRKGRSASRVILTSGLEIELEDAVDISESNAGTMVIGPEDSRTYIPWEETTRVDFDR